MNEQAYFVGRRPSGPADFISRHPVFRIEEAVAWYRDSGRGGLAQARRALRHHVSTGRLRMLRRGVYVHHDFFDPWIVTSRLAPDVIFAFDGALSLRGLGGAYNLSYLTRSRLQPICFNERILQPVRVETASAWNSLYPETIDVERAGFTLRVTRLERSLIDCVERLDRAPELPDLVDAFRLAGPINFDRLLDYVHARRSPLLAARLAFFLHCARRLDPVFGGALMSAGLQRPDYFLRTARGPEDSIIAKWNLIVSPEHRALYEAARNR